MKAGQRTIESSWCFFRGDTKIRDAVKYMMGRKQITAKALCEELDIKPYRMSLYLNNRWPNLNQYQLYKVCDRLDLSLSINIEMRNL